MEKWKPLTGCFGESLMKSLEFKLIISTINMYHFVNMLKRSRITRSIQKFKRLIPGGKVSILRMCQGAVALLLHLETYPQPDNMR